jgi:SNF2 family DNA or RNA helicase
LIEELQQLIPSHKALVFSQFTSMLDLLQRDLHAAGIATLRIDGSTPAAERQTIVNQFQVDAAAPYVMLISLKAGNAGLNLTAADYVFLFDPWWNVAVENQAIDRTHRIGQQQHVFAYRMICKNTVEEKIMQLKERKQKVADTLITTDEGLLQGITEADLAFLFQ